MNSDVAGIVKAKYRIKLVRVLSQSSSLWQGSQVYMAARMKPVDALKI